MKPNPLETEFEVKITLEKRIGIRFEQLNYRLTNWFVSDEGAIAMVGA